MFGNCGQYECTLKNNVTGEIIAVKFDREKFNKIDIGDIISLNTVTPILFEATDVEIIKCPK